jgi:hypothetical protein
MEVTDQQQAQLLAHGLVLRTEWRRCLLGTFSASKVRVDFDSAP